MNEPAAAPPAVEGVPILVAEPTEEETLKRLRTLTEELVAEGGLRNVALANPAHERSQRLWEEWQAVLLALPENPSKEAVEATTHWVELLGVNPIRNPAKERAPSPYPGANRAERRRARKTLRGW